MIGDLERPDFASWVNRLCDEARARGVLGDSAQTPKPAPDIYRDERGRVFVRLPPPDLSCSFPEGTPRNPAVSTVTLAAMGYERGRPTLSAGTVLHLVGPAGLGAAFRLALDLGKLGKGLPLGYVSAASLPGEYGVTLEERPERTIFVGEVGAYIGRARLHYVTELVLRMRATKRAIVLVGDPVPGLGPERWPEWARLDEALTRYGARRVVCS